MIHRRKGRKLKRTASHRKSLFSNMTVSLIKNKKIRTTLAKAKELRLFVEPMITKSRKAYLAKDGKPEYGVHLRREVNKFLQDREAVKTLFDEIAPKLVNRNGGYTRVLKMGNRLGDGAEVAMIELVDYNLEQYKTEATAAGETDSKTKSKAKGKTGTEKTKTVKAKSEKTKTTKTKKEDKSSAEVKKSTKGKKKKEAAE